MRHMGFGFDKQAVPVELLPAALRRAVEEHVARSGVDAGEVERIRLSISSWNDGWAAATITYRVAHQWVESVASLRISEEDAIAVFVLQRGALGKR